MPEIFLKILVVMIDITTQTCYIPVVIEIVTTKQRKHMEVLS